MWIPLVLVGVLSCVTSACPIVYVVNHPGELFIQGGTSVRHDGTFLDPQTLDPLLHTRIQRVYSCVTIKSIDTDDEEYAHEHINQWIVRDCKRETCVVISKSPRAYRKRTVSDVFELRHKTRTELIRVSIVPPSPAPTRSSRCEDQGEEDCPQTLGCTYFGAVYRCQLDSFCGFTNKAACALADWCTYTDRCLPLQSSD